MSTAAAIQTVLVALLVGVALPLLLQMFVTVRALQRTAERVERRLDGALADVSHLASRLDASPRQSEAAALVGAALVPAALAAIRTFRAHTHGTSEPNGTASSAP
jgi:hypothetical protein